MANKVIRLPVDNSIDSSNTNGTTYRTIFKNGIKYFLSQAGTDRDYTQIKGLVPPSITPSRVTFRRASFWSMIIGSYLFLNDNISDANRTELETRLKTIVNNYTADHFAIQNANADSVLDSTNNVNSGWGWAWQSTLWGSHFAWGAYLQPHLFSDAEMEKILKWVAIEADGLGFGKYTMRYNAGGSTSISITAPPASGGIGTRRQATAAFATNRIVITDAGSGYDPANPPMITMSSSTAEFLNTKTPSCALHVNAKGEVEFGIFGTHPDNYVVNSLAEEIAWTTWMTEVATAMLREHPNYDRWREFNIKNRLQQVTREADFDDNRMIDGKLLSEWLTPTNGQYYANYNEHYMFGNHWIDNHPSYVGGANRSTLFGALIHLISGQSVPQAYSYNMRECYRAMAYSTNIPGLVNTIRASEGNVTVNGRVFQENGVVNWPQRALENRDTEDERRGNYAVYSLLCTFAKLFFNETQTPTPETYETGFLSKITESQQASGLINSIAYANDGKDGDSHSLFANFMRDIAIGNLAYHMNENRAIQDLYTFPARYYEPAITGFSISGHDISDGNFAGSVTLAYTVSNSNNVAGNLVLSYSTDGTTFTDITGLTISPTATTATVTLPSISIANGATVNFKLTATDTQSPAQTHESEAFDITRRAPQSASSLNNVISIRGGSAPRYNNRMIGWDSGFRNGGTQPQGVELNSYPLTLGTVTVRAVRFTTRRPHTADGTFQIFYVNTSANAVTLDFTFTETGNTSNTLTKRISLASQPVNTVAGEAGAPYVTNYTPDGTEYNELMALFGGLPYDSNKRLDLTITEVL